MARRTQRMQQAMKYFMIHHENGESIKEIATRYGVSYGGLLSNLGEINGVPRISLLEAPEKSHIGHIGRGPVNSNYTKHTSPHSSESSSESTFESIGYLDTIFEKCQNLIEEVDQLLNNIKENVLC